MNNKTYTSMGAKFTEGRTHRLVLWRYWGPPPPSGVSRRKQSVLFIGLNPSTADEITDDMTIKKCVGFAKQWSYQGIYMLNLYSYRTAYPLQLLAATDPIGNPANDNVLGYYAPRVGKVVVCWGGVPRSIREHLQWIERIKTVKDLITQPLYCLGLTQSGDPRHPSRLAYSTELVPYEV
jgi:hypothetical protein